MKVGLPPIQGKKDTKVVSFFGVGIIEHLVQQ